jgi:predicted phosphodiesterase
MLIKKILNPIFFRNTRCYSTKLAYVSDLHLENYRWKTNYPRINKTQLKELENNDIHGIAILGDLSNPTYDNFTHFLSYCGSIFKNVYFVAGNHEYYLKGGCKHNIKEVVEYRINTSIEKAKVKSNNSSIHYLNNSHIQLKNNKIILGTTLWSDQTMSLKNTLKSKSQYSFMYKFIIEQHIESYKYLKENIDLCKDFNRIYYLKKPNVTILTHYLPTYFLVVDKYKEIYSTDRAKSERYFSNLDYLINYPIKNWICGHSHSVYNNYLNGVYLGINSYVSQNTHEINLKFIEL